MKKTTIKNENNNGVFHNVTIKLDGTIEAVKIIDGTEVQTYDWSYMTAEEVYETAKDSGHQQYTIFEEEEEVEALTQGMNAGKIRKTIADATKGYETFEYEIKFDAQQVEGYTDVSLVVSDEEGEMIADVLVASVENESDANMKKAEAMAKRLNKKYGKTL